MAKRKGPKLDKAVHFRVSGAERAEIIKAAARHGVGVAEFVLQAARAHVASRPTTVHITQQFKDADPDKTARLFKSEVGKMVEQLHADSPAQQARDKTRAAAEVRKAAKRQADAQRRCDALTSEYERGGQSMALFCIEALAQEGFIQQAAGPRALNAVLACIERCIYRIRITSCMTNAGVPPNPPARSFPPVAP
jgi:hypothetical protein